MIANKSDKDVQVQMMQASNILKSQNKRIGYFDLLKTISIFLVIYVHYPWISTSKGSNLTMIMTIIAVPLFFMINGALLLGKRNFNIISGKVRRNIKKRRCCRKTIKHCERKFAK